MTNVPVPNRQRVDGSGTGETVLSSVAVKVESPESLVIKKSPSEVLALTDDCPNDAVMGPKAELRS
jgi:hypothetical protein